MFRNSVVTTTAEVTSVGALWLETTQEYAVVLGRDTTIRMHPADAEQLHLVLGRAIGEQLRTDPAARLKFLATELDCAGLPDAAVMLRTMAALVPEGVRA
ncbi:hypothetical protein [Nocardia wallacei]|uniref:hypothetical protein n=1 Tax=Nocardia wallacei TaxID=480035 RepID=UPI00245774AC|nr:hypothetical protein [Nocardia wallacei]